MSKIVKGIGSVVGLAREAQHRNDAPNTSTSTPQEPADHDGDDSDYSVDDEAHWQLDEAQNELEDESKEAKEDGPTLDDLIAAAAGKGSGKLPCPVILPQRRPETKRRGFIRAYAPMLEECGIDQQLFMKFLDAFDKAIESSPWFHVVNAAVAVNLAFPSVVVHSCAMAVHISIETVRRIQVTRQSNHFLNKMNEQLFVPHGLYCMIWTYKPDSNSGSEIVDVTGKLENTAEEHSQKKKNNFKATSGKAHGEAELPEAAPLIFPTLDAAPEEKKKNVLRRGQFFAADYYDRRAQATYNAQNPGSKLSVAPQPQFESRYGDPNHPANSGSLLALVSGGAINPKELRHQRRERRAQRLGRVSRLGEKREQREEARRSGTPRGVMGTVKQYLKEGILYLVVVQMPSNEEMDMAAAEEQKLLGEDQQVAA